MERELKTAQVNIRFRPSLLVEIRRDAAKRGQPLSVWIERLALAALKKRGSIVKAMEDVT